MMDPADLTPYENNPRDNDGAVEAVANSIREFGFKAPIIVDRDHVIIAGHTRLKAALSLGLKEVPVIVADDLDDAQVRAYRLADNKTGEIAIWLEEALAKELAGIDGIDMAQFGFDVEEAGDIGEWSMEGDPDELPDEPEPDAPPRARRGQIWRLGEHRLMCGDSADERDVATLMKGERADMAFTDPPWNVAYDREILNDDMDEGLFLEFMDKAIVNLSRSLTGGGMVYIVMAIEQLWRIMDLLERAGLHWSSTIMWVKDQFALSRKDYHMRYEPIWYGWESSEARRHPLVPENATDTLTLSRKDYHTRYEPIFYGWKAGEPRRNPLTDRTQDDVWEFDRPKASEEHPMMKPVALVARAIENSSGLGETVLDLFGGSGTTLMACEQTQRRCRMMELDPRYCDVIIARWEKATGRKAELMEESRWRPSTSPSARCSAGSPGASSPTWSPTSSQGGSRGGARDDRDGMLRRQPRPSPRRQGRGTHHEESRHRVGREGPRKGLAQHLRRRHPPDRRGRAEDGRDVPREGVREVPRRMGRRRRDVPRHGPMRVLLARVAQGRGEGRGRPVERLARRVHGRGRERRQGGDEVTQARVDELMALFSDESVRTVVRPLVEELADVEDRIREVKRLPLIRVHPQDPSIQKSTAAGRLYHTLLAKQTDIVRMLLRQLGKSGDDDEDSPLRAYLRTLDR